MFFYQRNDNDNKAGYSNEQSQVSVLNHDKLFYIQKSFLLFHIYYNNNAAKKNFISLLSME